MTERPRARALVAATAAVVAALGLATGAHAEAPAEAGYWWRFQAVAGGPLAPQGVADDQLHVAADAGGPSAVAALRAEVGDRPVESIVLVEASSSGTPDLLACPTEGWTEPDGAGAWGDRPSDAACEADGVPGTRDDDGTWRFAATTLVRAGTLDVVVVPVGGSQAVTFEAPGAATIALAPPPPAPTTTAPAPTTAAPRPAPTTPSTTRATRPAATPTTSPLVTIGDDAPSSGLAAGPPGVPVQSFDRDVDGFPAPTDQVATGPLDGDGSRTPLAILPVLVLAGAWGWRTRSALAAAPQHVLAQPLRHRRSVLADAGARVAADPHDEPGPERAGGATGRPAREPSTPETGVPA